MPLGLNLSYIDSASKKNKDESSIGAVKNIKKKKSFNLHRHQGHQYSMTPNVYKGEVPILS